LFSIAKNNDILFSTKSSHRYLRVPYAEAQIQKLRCDYETVNHADFSITLKTLSKREYERVKMIDSSIML